MAVEIITRDDLMQFKSELLGDIKTLLANSPSKQKNWLRTKEVLELLKISPGTLQNYRVNGLIKCRRIGKTIYYALDEIENMMLK